MTEGPAKAGVHAAALCLISLLLALAGATIPIAGVLFALLIPLPLIILFSMHGRAVVLLSMVALWAALAALLGRGVAWIVLVEFGLPAAALAEARRRDWTTERSVAAGGLAMIAGSLLALLSLSWSVGSPIEYLVDRVDRAIQDTTALYTRMGLSADEVGALTISGAKARRLFVVTSPGLLVAAALLTTFANYFMARAAVARASGSSGSSQGFAWTLPDWLVWLFIASAVLFLTGVPVITEIGLNGLIVMVTLYFLQGLAIAAFWSRRLRLPPLVGILGAVLLLIQPFLVFLLAGVGLFDTWFVFRRQTLPGPPGA